MFERFTTEARTAVVQAHEEARMLGDSSICSEHLLVGLAGTGTGPAAAALRRAGITAEALRDRARQERLDPDALALLGIDLDQVRRAAEERFGPGALDRTGNSARRSSKRHLPVSSDAKEALALSVRAAGAVRTGTISSGHVLIGILDARSAAVIRALTGCGADPVRLRAEVESLLRAQAA